jgi:hypothetical protein
VREERGGRQSRGTGEKSGTEDSGGGGETIALYERLSLSVAENDNTPADSSADPPSIGGESNGVA